LHGSLNVRDRLIIISKSCKVQVIQNMGRRIIGIQLQRTLVFAGRRPSPTRYRKRPPARHDRLPRTTAGFTTSAFDWMWASRSFARSPGTVGLKSGSCPSARVFAPRFSRRHLAFHKPFSSIKMGRGLSPPSDMLGTQRKRAAGLGYPFLLLDTMCCVCLRLDDRYDETESVQISEYFETCDRDVS
jgi:hypothetical protein